MTTASGIYGTVATGIDDVGDVVGYFVDGSAVTHGFVDFGGAAGGTNFITVDTPTADTVTVVNGIDDWRVVAGTSLDTGGGFTGFTAKVPEPASLALFGLGSLCPGMPRRLHRLSHRARLEIQASDIASPSRRAMSLWAVPAEPPVPVSLY